jgi:hypothetical protein
LFRYAQTAHLATFAWQLMDSAPLTTLAEVGRCGPDGDIHSATSADSLMPDALQGALIGKIGGSSGAIKNTGAFVVGSHCVLEIDDKLKGPLYCVFSVSVRDDR